MSLNFELGQEGFGRRAGLLILPTSLGLGDLGKMAAAFHHNREYDQLTHLGWFVHR
jgi:hypothetical protein